MKNRLTKSQWLDHGLEVLASTGAGALKAEPMSRSLGVTRGSFYWHFVDIHAFHHELLLLWKKRACDDVIREIDNEQNENDRLRALLSIAMLNDQKLERAVRSWAVQSKLVAQSVAFVDDVRLDYLIQILGSSHSDANEINVREINVREIKIRAELIYWSWLGRMMVANNKDDWSQEEISKVANLFRL